MAINQNQNARPGVGTALTSAPRRVMLADAEFKVRGAVIDGSLSRDPGNTSSVDYLRAGTMLGKITASDLYRPASIGVLTVAYVNDDSTQTQMTVGTATATELARLGSSGTFTITGPPSAAGTVATETVTYSAVNTTTGVITVTAAGADYIAGARLGGVDGSQVPVLLLGDGQPLKVTDASDASIDPETNNVVIGGVVDSSQVIDWPSDTSMIAALKAQFNTVSGSRFVFDDAF